VVLAIYATRCINKEVVILEDSMAQVFINDREGKEEVLEIQPGETLMQVISNAGVSDLLALCGGVCACATCHIYVEQEPSGDLPAMGEDEDALLDGSMHRQANSRLSCQIRLTNEHDGLKATIAPED